MFKVLFSLQDAIQTISCTAKNDGANNYSISPLLRKTAVSVIAKMQQMQQMQLNPVLFCFITWSVLSDRYLAYPILYAVKPRNRQVPFLYGYEIITIKFQYQYYPYFWTIAKVVPYKSDNKWRERRKPI